MLRHAVDHERVAHDVAVVARRGERHPRDRVALVVLRGRREARPRVLERARAVDVGEIDGRAAAVGTMKMRAFAFENASLGQDPMVAVFVHAPGVPVSGTLIEDDEAPSGENAG